MKNQTEISTQNYVSEFYEEQRYQKPYARLYHEWWTRKMISEVTCSGNILDNGSGTGILGEALGDNGSTLVGLDISPNMLSFARKRIKLLIQGDSQQLPFGDKAFDLVVGRSLLHHLPDPAQGVAEMARVLRRGGEMVVVDTNNSLISNLPRAIANKGEHFSDDHKNMTVTELKGMIERHFIVDKIMYFGYLAYPIGFPDIMDLGKFIPFVLPVTSMLIKIDELISRIPWLKTQSWGVMIKATKKEVLS